MSLKFIAISGTTGVTENHYIYEYGEDMIVVDCGVGFPESGMFGVDLVVPDFTYVRQNSRKLKAILITHGHEDHIGALPFLLKEVKAPIYATKLVAGFIEEKFADYGIKNTKVNVFDPKKDSLSIGAFRVHPFRISHSVPDSVGFAIDTPQGRVFHVADYKFDWTPVSKDPFDINKLAVLASEGALAVASDCLGSTSPGYTESEYAIEKRIEQIARGAKGQIYFTTISSNISRIQQALNVAQRLSRRVAFIGRSIERKVNIAKRLGYIHYPDTLVVKARQTKKLPRGQVMYIISGSYGQPGSALYRVSQGEHDFLSIQLGDVVIFSSDPAPPGSKENVDFVVNSLIELNADVHYYDIQEDLHVSGHGSQEDIKMLFGIVKPRYFIPIGGTVRHMRAYKDLAVSMGAKETDVFELVPGDIIEFSDGSARKAGRMPVREVLVDGLGIGDVGEVVLRDRQILAKDGAAVVLIQIDKQKAKLITDPEIISRGFVFQGKERGFLISSAQKLKREMEGARRLDKMSAKNITIDFLERYFFKETGRRPMILPVIVEV
jgi:ribonuclease J